MQQGQSDQVFLVNKEGIVGEVMSADDFSEPKLEKSINRLLTCHSVSNIEE